MVALLEFRVSRDILLKRKRNNVKKYVQVQLESEIKIDEKQELFVRGGCLPAQPPSLL